MELPQLILLTLVVTFGFFHNGAMDGKKDHGEPCSLRSQIANVFRTNDSPEGCMSAKGLVCLNNKCVCADPSNIYEVVEPADSTDTASSITSAASSFLKGLITGGKKNQPAETAGSGTTGTGSQPGAGKCVGRSMSPCFTQNSTCVKHAICGGTPRVCKCQGIYSSNTSGHCSKSASVLNQVIKNTVG